MKRLGASFVAVGTLAALAPAASAHHQPNATASCPSHLSATVRSTCTALQGIEYSLRHGGAVDAASAFASTSVSATQTYAASVKAAVDVYRSTLAGSAGAFSDAVDSATAGVVVGADTYSATAVNDALNLLDGTSTLSCPLESAPNPPTFPSTYGVLKQYVCTTWGSLRLVPEVADITALADYLRTVGSIVPAGDLRNAVSDLQTALTGASWQLASTASTGTDGLGAKVVDAAYNALRCARPGNYDPNTVANCPPQ